MNRPWKTCSPSSSIESNDVNGPLSMRENIRQSDIKRSSESLSHGEIGRSGTFYQPDTTVRDPQCGPFEPCKTNSCWIVYRSEQGDDLGLSLGFENREHSSGTITRNIRS
jgi:hypothetical protein